MWSPKVKGEAGRPPPPLLINIAVTVPENAADRGKRKRLLKTKQMDIIHRR